MKKTFTLLLLTLLSSTAVAQTDDITVLFESQPGFRLSVVLDSGMVGFRDRADLNRDGVADLTMLRRDEQGNPLEIYTLDVTPDQATTLWQYPYQDVATALGTTSFRFLGFLSFADGDPRHAIFRSRDALAIIGVLAGSASPGAPLVLPIDGAAVLDLTGDGYAEVVIENRDTGTVQVWGGNATNTATEAAIEAALHRLFQNYPNPFRDRTTIAYAVEQPGPVTVTVYDLLGRHVRTLVEADQPPGTYNIEWDGRDAGGQPVASGTYFYRLRVGETVAGKQALHIK